ncbi:MAG: hypothetical protein AB8F74_23420, partial [Saprospiraceae bacterium]
MPKAKKWIAFCGVLKLSLHKNVKRYLKDIYMENINESLERKKRSEYPGRPGQVRGVFSRSNLPQFWASLWNLNLFYITNFTERTSFCM